MKLYMIYLLTNYETDYFLINGVYYIYHHEREYLSKLTPSIINENHIKHKHYMDVELPSYERIIFNLQTNNELKLELEKRVNQLIFNKI